jgi:hypothetical protein
MHQDVFDEIGSPGECGESHAALQGWFEAFLRFRKSGNFNVLRGFFRFSTQFVEGGGFGVEYLPKKRKTDILMDGPGGRDTTTEKGKATCRKAAKMKRIEK